MKTKKFLLALSILLFCAVMSTAVFAETRNIYPGDIITLKITSQGYSTEELANKFADFEIVEMKIESSEYLLSLRTFNTGEYKILLGDKEIVINVQSTLDYIQRDDIFEGEARVVEAGFIFHWRILFYVASGVFILSGIFAAIKILLKRKTKPLSPLALFLRDTGKLSPEDENYFVGLTFCFKEYLESLYKFRIIGKTTSEIADELKGIPALETLLTEVKKWLTECDRLKFTGVKVSGEIKQEHCKELIKLVEKIDMQYKQKEVTA